MTGQAGLLRIPSLASVMTGLPFWWGCIQWEEETVPKLFEEYKSRLSTMVKSQEYRGHSEPRSGKQSPAENRSHGGGLEGMGFFLL